MAKFNRILDVDRANRCAVVQPGVTNLAITSAVEVDGFTTRPIRRARSPAPSAATWRRTPAGALSEYGLTTNNPLGCELC